LAEDLAEVLTEPILRVSPEVTEVLVAVQVDTMIMPELFWAEPEQLVKEIEEEILLRHIILEVEEEPEQPEQIQLPKQTGELVFLILF